MSLTTRSSVPHSHFESRRTPSFRNGRRSLQLVFALAIPVLAACGDRVTDATSPPSLSSSGASATRSFPTTLATVVWQEQARVLVKTHPATMTPIVAGRVYAMLSVAQYGAVVDADKQVDADGILSSDGFGDGGRS